MIQTSFLSLAKEIFAEEWAYAQEIAGNDAESYH